MIWVQEEPIDPFLLEMLALYRFRRAAAHRHGRLREHLPAAAALCRAGRAAPPLAPARPPAWPSPSRRSRGFAPRACRTSVPASTLVAGGLEPEGEVAAIPLPDADSGFTVGFAGRLIEAKGWKVLVRALPEGARLVLAGDGPQRAELEALAAEDDRIRYLGFMPKDELWSLLCRARLPRRAVPDDSALEGAVGERRSSTGSRWGCRSSRRTAAASPTSWARPVCSSPRATRDALRNALVRVRDDPALREQPRDGRPRALPPRVRHPGLRGEDSRPRLKTSRTLGSLANP